MGMRVPSEYRLTFYADYAGNAASNEWKRVTRATVQKLHEAERALKRKAKKQKSLL